MKTKHTLEHKTMPSAFFRFYQNSNFFRKRKKKKKLLTWLHGFFKGWLFSNRRCAKNHISQVLEYHRKLKRNPCKYHLSINFLAQKKDRISHHQKVQNTKFQVISKYISVNFLAQEKTVFPISEKVKTKTFQ